MQAWRKTVAQITTKDSRQMIVLMFQPRFAALVESGKKRQTIRPTRKRPIKTGDELSLRTWTGKPYRSKQRLLWPNTTPCHVSRIHIDHTAMHINGFYLRPEEKSQLARNDGFSGLIDMLQWFENTHGLPFYGILIKW